MQHPRCGGSGAPLARRMPTLLFAACRRNVGDFESRCAWARGGLVAPLPTSNKGRRRPGRAPLSDYELSRACEFIRMPSYGRRLRAACMRSYNHSNPEHPSQCSLIGSDSEERCVPPRPFASFPTVHRCGWHASWMCAIAHTHAANIGVRTLHETQCHGIYMVCICGEWRSLDLRDHSLRERPRPSMIRRVPHHGCAVLAVSEHL